MKMHHDTFETITECENAVHEAFTTHRDHLQALPNRAGAHYTEFGKDVVIMAMTSCMRIAHLRNRFRS